MSTSQPSPDLPDPFCPPGTVILITERTATETTEINLEPRPTNDPNDPLNWTTTRKLVNFILTLSLTATFFTAMSIQTIFWQLFLNDFKVEFSQLNKTYAVGLCGTATGCLIFIPFAQKYGRRPVYLVTALIMVVTNFWSAKMTTLGEIFATNLIQGLAGSTNETIVQMTIADIFFVHHRGTANSLYMIMVMIGSFLSPIFAGYMAESFGWRNCYFVLGSFSALNWVLLLFFFEESKLHIPVIQSLTPQIDAPAEESNSNLDRTDKPAIDPLVTTTKVGSTPEQTPEQTPKHQHHIDPSIPLKPYKWRMRPISKSDMSLKTLFYRPFIVLFSFPAITYTALQYAFGLCWISVMGNIISQVMSGPPYNFKTGAIGLMSLGPFIGCILGALYGGMMADWVIVKLARRNGGYYEPEMRLQLMHLPAFVMPAGILLFGLSISKGLHWIYPSVGGGLFGFGLGSITDNALTLAIDSYRDITGEAFTGIAFLRNTFSIALVFALAPWVQSQGLRNMFIVDAVWAWVICMLYLPLLIWGKKIRARTAKHYRRLVATRSHSR